MSETMDFGVVKGKPLSKEETKALLQLIESSKVLTSKATNATNNKLKNKEWIRLTDRFNAIAATSRRTPQQLRLKWENLKKNARKHSTKIRMNHIQTGGGAPDYVPPDDILDRVTSLLGSTAKTGKKKIKQVSKKDESEIAKNIAIAEYFTAKKQCMDAKLNILLENEKLKLENEKLKIELNHLKN